MKTFISYIFIVVITLAMVGCSTNTDKKIKSLTSIVEVTSNLAYQQNRALTKSNVVLATEYNRNIAAIVGEPTDKKTTNFTSVISQVVNYKYEIDRSLVLELEKANDDLKHYKSKFGLVAIKLGFIQLFKSVMYSALGLTVLYILLRVFASSNPIVLAIFNFISIPIAYVINLIAKLFPTMMDKIGDETLTLRNFFKKIFRKNGNDTK